MRILLVSDLHYRLRQFDWVLRAASEFDLVVLAGDHLDISSTVPLEAQSVVVLQYLALLRDAGHLVVMSSGNHDLTGQDERGEQCALWLEQARAPGVSTDGDSLSLGDLLITVCPWWDGPAGREATLRLIETDAVRRPARWLWVYHWPPADSPVCWTGYEHYGDADVASWIAQYKPDLVLTGHVHQSPFTPDGSWADRIGPTWVFNAGHQIGAVPAHIRIDLAEDSATWWSMLGAEKILLTNTTGPERTVF